MKPGLAVRLREVRSGDLPVFFEHQCDPDAVRMAAFTAEDPTDRAAFDAHWKRILGMDSVTVRTVLADDAVAGHVAAFVRDGDPEITVWLGREFWGRGIGTEALRRLLELRRERPIYARAAADNGASLRALEKLGFRISGEERGYAAARGREIAEYVLVLE